MPNVGEQCQRHREHDRATDALHRPGHVQHQRASGKPTQQRRASEHDQPRQEEQAPAVHVGQAAGGQQEGGQRQRVRIDDPLQAGEAGPQPPLDARQRDGHDGDVQQQHEDAQAHRDQRPPLAARPCRRTRPLPTAACGTPDSAVR